MLDHGVCTPQQAPIHFLPFRAGTRTRVMQGFDGYLSHKGDLAFSVDLKAKQGTPVTASRPGIVWALKEDSNSGCGNPRCADMANYVILDHGDGTYSEYYHLRELGVLVEEGEHVCSGQVIGLSGNTGFSTGPHLHFAVTDLTRQTIPFQFYEARVQERFGYPIPDASLVSMNRLHTRCGDLHYSKIGTDAFSMQGIVLDDELPTVYAKHRPLHISGHYYGDHHRIALHRKATSGGAWIDQCVRVKPNGRFDMTVTWPLERFAPGTYWLMLTGANKDCLAPGWAWSYKIRVR